MKRTASITYNESVLFKILKENGDEKLWDVWNMLLDGEKSKYDSKGDIPVINYKARKSIDQSGVKRYCWTCNKSLYGPTLKYNNMAKSIPVYHLAMCGKIGFYKLLSDRENENGNEEEGHYWKNRAKLVRKRIKELDSKSFHITHTCGNGRKEGEPDLLNVCINPDHLIIRSKKYNETQTHCHYFLHNAGVRKRKAFIKNRMCSHYPKCF